MIVCMFYSYNEGSVKSYVKKYTVKNIAGSQDSYYFNSLFWPMKFHLLSSLSLTVELAEDQAARKEGGQETI